MSIPCHIVQKVLHRSKRLTFERNRYRMALARMRGPMQSLENHAFRIRRTKTRGQW